MYTSVQAAKETKVNNICKTVIEFALEYRNSRERIVQARKRLAEKRERNKTRGKIWVDGTASSQPSTLLNTRDMTTAEVRLMK